jgi:hypothetical protein
MKYDGCRTRASIGGHDRPVLWTRNLNTVTSSYQEVADALTAVFGGRGRIVLDGEIVALHVGALVLGAYDDQGALRCRARRDRLHSGWAPATRGATGRPRTSHQPDRRRVRGRGTARCSAVGRPDVVVDIDIREYGPGGLRHPSYTGQRPDLDPEAVFVPES